MLLPSAFPFDTLHQPHQATPSTSTPPPPSPGGLISLSSCRALQAILGNRPSSPFRLTLSTCSQPKNEKPAPSSRRKEPSQQRTPLLPLTENTNISKRPHTQSQAARPVGAPRRTNNNKRSRASFEETDENDLYSSSSSSRAADPDYSSYDFPHCNPTSRSTNTTTLPPEINPFSTPKRQRRVPLLMPLGLSAEDFEGLDNIPQAPLSPPKELVEEKVDLPASDNNLTEDTANDESGWSAADDRMLVSTVLDKLNLSRREWNDCGRRMEKDSDSLGKRWRLLVGDGEAALRRGSGGRSRPELTGDFWQG